MREPVRRATVREGYRILLVALLETALPEQHERILAFSTRTGECLFRELFRAEGERARADYAALETTDAKARFRTRRLKVQLTGEELAPGLLRVTAEAAQDGEVLRREAWLWNTDEETLLPPAQVRRVRRKMVNISADR